MDEIVLEANKGFDEAIEKFKVALGKLRSARANPAILNGIKCDYYGEKMEVVNLCRISMPEPRQLLVKPYAKEDLKSIAAAIGAANLGFNIQMDSDSIRILIPPMTMEIRQDVAKQAKALSEEAKLAIRNVRHDCLDLLKEDDSMSDDYKQRVEDDIQKAVGEANKKIEAILGEKQKEILTV